MAGLSSERPEDGSNTTALRAGTPQDAEAAGRICHRAFTAIATAHGYPSDFPAPEIGIGLMTMLLSHPGFYSVVAERAGPAHARAELSPHRHKGANAMLRRRLRKGDAPLAKRADRSTAPRSTKNSSDVQSG